MWRSPGGRGVLRGPEHPLAFSLGKGEHGETDLIQMEIDTGDAAPRKQLVRRMPFAARSEIA